MFPVMTTRGSLEGGGYFQRGSGMSGVGWGRGMFGAVGVCTGGGSYVQGVGYIEGGYTTWHTHPHPHWY